MSTVVDEFVAHLDEVCALPPREALDALWRLGLEREAIVTVAYRRDVIEHRLLRMPIDDETRAVVARAVRWTWRDEQAHALWLRGALAHKQDPAAILAVIEGKVGGWVSSRESHFTWRESPARRLVADALEAAGALTGRIPASVRGELRWHPFREVAAFNVQAETTAGLAWRRMAAIAANPSSGAHPDDSGVFIHIADDEARHAELYGILAEAFDDRDHLAPGWDAARLRAELGAIGQRFVAVPAGGGNAWRNPLGKGARVAVREGEILDRALEDVLAAIDAHALLHAHTPGDRPPRVAIKTTFMMVADAKDPSPAVSPALIRKLAAWFSERGAEVEVIDARNVYDEHRAHRTVAEVAAYLNLVGDFTVVDSQRDQAPHGYLRGIGPDTIARAWRDADVRVVLGKLRTHPTSVLTLSLDAAEGLCARHDEGVWFDRHAERETAVCMALDAFPPHLALLDAWHHVPDGLLGMLGTDEPLTPHRLYASQDAVALDVVAARHVGVDPTANEGMLLSHAFDWYGDPRSTLNVDGPDAPIAAFRLPDHGLRTAVLTRLALPVYTHASGRGALFLPDFDAVAFPPLHANEGRVVHAARAVIRRITSDGRPADLLPTESLRIGGGNVRYARIGHGPPIVLLHGYPDDLQVFARLAPRLAERHTVIAFDWPGLGHSSPWPGPLGPHDLADRLRMILDALGVHKVALLGHDMGAHPALCFAERWPERVTRVIAMNALLFGDGQTSFDIALMRRAGLAGLALALAPGIVFERCLATFLPRDERLGDAVDADLRGAWRQADVRRTVTAMCAAYDRDLAHLPDTYWQLRTPLHLIWAENDAHFPVSQASRMCALLPTTRLDVVPGATHWMVHSRADDVARLVEDAWTS